MAMLWKQFFTPVKNMEADEARDYIKSQKEGTFTLLDVRQLKEYEKERIPGATLMPLPELPERLRELDPDKPTIAY
jgi:rhodanese-related sulfurtransferase